MQKWKVRFFIEETVIYEPPGESLIPDVGDYVKINGKWYHVKFKTVNFDEYIIYIVLDEITQF